MDIGVVLQCTPPAARVIDLASRAETYGFSYVWTFDSHILWEEPYVIYSKILDETRKVIVGPMVTNPATRDITVTASVFATLNEMYGNRTVIGIGRGDSAVRVTNGKPVSVAELRQAVRRHQGPRQRARPSSTRATRCAFPGPGASRTDVFVAAYGPKMLALTGEVGDGFILQLADPHIAEWTIKAVRDAAEAAGRNPDDVYICVAAPAYVTDGSRGGARPRARPAPLVRRHGRQPRRGHRRPLRRERRRGPAGPHRLHQEPAGLRLQRARAGRQHPHRLRPRRDRRPLLHHRPAGGAHPSDWRSSRRSASNQFAVYLQHDDKDHTLAQYGEKVIPAVQEHLRATS